ncbi:MAG: DUF1761 domain-containing protein [Bacteroidota bacterium]
MFPINFYMYFIIALVPMVVGAAYYHPKVVGGAWMKTNGFTMESLQGGNMAVIMGVAYLLSFIFVFAQTPLVFHQAATASLLFPEAMEAGPVRDDLIAFMGKYGDRHMSYSHGALHGFINSLFLVLPVIGIVANFERRGWKYILIHFGYWAITLTLVGALICGTLQYPPLT